MNGNGNGNQDREVEVTDCLLWAFCSEDWTGGSRWRLQGIFVGRMMMMVLKLEESG